MNKKTIVSCSILLAAMNLPTLAYAYGEGDDVLESVNQRIAAL